MHKDTIFCVIFDGKDSKVEKFGSFTPELQRMCDHIMSHSVDVVAMESTGIYIDAIRTMLRRNGQKSVVVNPYLIKQMPGRKSDVKDSIFYDTLQSTLWPLRERVIEYHQ